MDLYECGELGTRALQRRWPTVYRPERRTASLLQRVVDGSWRHDDRAAQRNRTDARHVGGRRRTEAKLGVTVVYVDAQARDDY